MRPSFLERTDGSVSVTPVGVPSSGPFDPFTIDFPSQGSLALQTCLGVDRPKPESFFMNGTDYSLETRRFRATVGTYHRRDFFLGTYSGGFSTSGHIGAGTGSGCHNSDTVLVSGFPTSYDEDLQNEALIKTLGKIKKSSVNLGLAIAEMNKTAFLVGDTARKLVDMIRALRRFDFATLKRTLKTKSRIRLTGNNLSQKWLEIQYGWKPLLSDVYGAADALSRRGMEDWSVHASARSTRRTVYKGNPLTGWSDEYGLAEHYYLCQERAYCRIEAIPGTEFAAQLVSLGITNPLLIGWELVPFSFVYDWIHPVGAWLNTLDADLALGAAQTVQTNVIRYESTLRGNGEVQTPGSGGWTYRNSFVGSGSYRIFKMKRNVSDGVVQPRFPSFKDPLSFEHMASGLALLFQACYGGNSRPLRL